MMDTMKNWRRYKLSNQLQYKLQFIGDFFYSKDLTMNRPFPETWKLSVPPRVFY
jgi:hypothetical protein